MKPSRTYSTDDDEELGLSEAAAPALTAEERAVQKKLGQGAYHLPGNNASQDFLQYVRNNHPLFAACCQSPLHPISRSMRAVGLLGSVMFGLILTNFIYMWQLYEQENDTEIIKLPDGTFAVSNGAEYQVVGDDNSAAAQMLAPSFEVSSTAMIVLWTAGSAVHSLFDTFLWYATSCACCGERCHGAKTNGPNQSKRASLVSRSRRYCNIIIVVLVMLATAAATLAVVIRAMLQENDQSLDSVLSANNATELQGLFASEGVSDSNNYQFLQAYAIELALSWFVWFFIFETLFFTGALTCGQRCLTSLLGGRPAEIKEEEEKKRKAEAKALRQSQKREASMAKKSKKKDVKPKRSSKSKTASKKSS
ncbi:MAG: hypothetical protein SGARI_005716, partial [Bacillariaceae sp.]